jgi:hypothetical protein
LKPHQKSTKNLTRSSEIKGRDGPKVILAHDILDLLF